MTAGVCILREREREREREGEREGEREREEEGKVGTRDDVYGEENRKNVLELKRDALVLR